MNIVRKEVHNSLHNIYFIIPCVLGIILSLIYSFKVIDLYLEYRKHISFDEILTQNTLAPTFNAYMLWIGGPRLENDKSTVIFFWYIIFASVIPYTWSYCAERKQGKVNKRIIHDKIPNKLSKYIAVFVSSGLLAAIPLLVNLISVLLFVPATKPDPVYNVYYHEFSSSFFGELYYSVPLLYELLYIFSFFVFCGLIGCVGYSISLIIKNAVIGISFPVILILAIHFLKNKVYFTYKHISPLEYMNVADKMFRNYKIMFIEMALMFVITIFGVLISKLPSMIKTIKNTAEANK